MTEIDIATDLSKEVKLQPYQDKFVFSPARHPCFVGGWAIGKTFCSIMRTVLYSIHIPNNLGIVFRKTFRSLQDSTMKDFEKYLHIKIPSDRNFVFPNGSTVMFRHMDELDSINQQNINLGFYFIEQGDELDSDKEFYMLFGRLRRKVEPDAEFLKYGLAPRSGWVIANAGDNWIKKLWKDGKLLEIQKTMDYDGVFSELIEAVTWDNKANLPKDFLDSLKVMEKAKPEIYKQFVLNDWTVGFKNKVLMSWMIDHMKSRQDLLARHSANAGVSIDPSGDGIDDNVFLAGKGGEVLEKFKKTSMSPSDRAHQAIRMCRNIGGCFIITDCDGVGIDTWKELTSLPEEYTRGITIVKFHGSAPSEVVECDRKVYKNMRAEAHFVTRQRGIDGVAGIDAHDIELIEDLSEPEFFTNNQGLIQIEDKKDIKERLGRSPGCGDAYNMLQWGFNQNYKYDSRAYESTRENLPKYAVVNDDVMGYRATNPEYAIHD